jgi:hypothetical protein
MEKIEKVDKEKKKWNGVLIAIVVIASVLVLLQLYQVWLMATARMSIEGECTIRQMDYVNLSGNGHCMIPFVGGDEHNVSICGIPRDISCKGSAQEIPLVRFVSALGR